MISRLLFSLNAFIISIAVYADDAAPADPPQPVCPGHNFGTIACNIMQSFTQIGTLIVALAYVAGCCFFVVSIFKFKQHKDNPTQIPVGTPIAYMCVASALIFLPTLISVMGESVFDDEATRGGFMGEGVQKIKGTNK